MQNKLLNKIKGFTLVETMVAIAVFTLIMGAASAFVISSYRVHEYTWDQSKAIDEARKGIELMTKEIREARTGEDGSYPLERAEEKQVVFYSDIDNDEKTEKVRYFLGTVNLGTLVQECQTSSGGGTCSVNFSNFLTGTLKSAQVKVSVDGDLDSSNEYVAISADGTVLDDSLCQNGCLHCAAAWQGTTVFDVTSQVQDDSIQFLADASSRVGKECPESNHNHSMKARFELSWTEEIIGAGNELKKGITEATGTPAQYLSEQEQVSVVTYYVRNAPPIFEYFDADGVKVTSLPSRLADVRVVKLFLVINVNPNRPPSEFELETSVQVRNLKTE
jgi:prepilin-type N-terminal cleavage/methylation domain-containing protein